MYVKIFDRILKSSIWDESSDARVAWFTLLLLADFEGYIVSTVSGIARAANLPIDAVQAAMDKFLEPDPSSTTDTDEGKRLEAVSPNRWRVINYSYYRTMATAEDERAASAVRSKRYRDRQRESGAPGDTSLDSDASRPVTVPSRYRHGTVTLTEAEAETDKEEQQAACTHTCVREEVFEGGEQDKPQGIEFDAAAGRFIGITPENIDSWRKAFPGVPIEADILQAAAYYRAHPERMGKGKAEGRLLAWFKRSQKGPAEIPAQKATSYVIPATPDRFKPPHDAAEHELLPPTIDWLSVLGALRDKVTPEIYDKWVANLPYVGDYVTHEGSGQVRHAVLQVADEYSKNHIHYNLGPSLADAISDVMGCSYRLAFKVVNAGV